MKIHKTATAALLTAAVAFGGATAAGAAEKPATTVTQTATATATPTTPATPSKGTHFTVGEKLDAFASEITPDNVTNFFGHIVSLVGSILGLVGKFAG